MALEKGNAMFLEELLGLATCSYKIANLMLFDLRLVTLTAVMVATGVSCCNDGKNIKFKNKRKDQRSNHNFLWPCRSGHSNSCHGGDRRSCFERDSDQGGRSTRKSQESADRGVR